MQTFGCQCRLSPLEMAMIPITGIEHKVRKRLARQLAEALLHEMELTEETDVISMSKIITVCIHVADDKDVQMLEKARKCFEATSNLTKEEDK